MTEILFQMLYEGASTEELGSVTQALPSRDAARKIRFETPSRNSNESTSQEAENRMKKTKKTALFGGILLIAAAMGSGAADVKENYEKACAKCHGADGKAKTNMGKKYEIKDLTDSTVQKSFTDEQAFKAIKEGIKDGDKTKMKPAEDLSDAEIKALVDHVRTLKK